MWQLIKKRRDEILKSAVAAILLAIPLYPKFPLLSVPGIYVSIRLEDFLLLLVFVFCLLVYFQEIKHLLSDRIVRAILIFLLISLVSLLSGIFLTRTVPFHIGILHLARRIEYFSGFLIGLLALRNSQHLNFYLKCLGIVVLLAFIFGLGQKYLYWPIVTTQNYEYSKGIALRYTPSGHLPSTFAGHYDLAAYLILVLPVFFGLFFLKMEKKIGLLYKTLIAGIILAGFWLLVNAVSRISMVSYLLAVSTTLFLLNKKKIIVLVVVLTLIFSGLSANLVSRYNQVFEVVKEKLLLGTSLEVYAQETSAKRTGSVLASPTPQPIFEDRSTSIRLNVEWPRAIRAFSKNPLLGTGFSSITLATDNDYLRLLGEVGLLGFFAFLLIIFEIANRLRKTLPLKEINLENVFLAGIVGSFFGILLNAVFIDVFEASKFAISFWLLLGFAIAIAKTKRNEKTN